VETTLESEVGRNGGHFSNVGVGGLRIGGLASVDGELVDWSWRSENWWIGVGGRRIGGLESEV